MGKNNRVLFAGNGLAMRIGISNQWNDIIEKCREKYNPALDSEYLRKLPNNMQIVAATHDNVDGAMAELCRNFKGISLDEEQKTFAKIILELPFDRIITTNYTYELERAVCDNKSFCCKYHEEIKRRKSDMTLFGYIPVKIGEKEKQIWHAHGHSCAPSTVIMGHYFYGKLLSRIQRYIPNMMKGWHTSEKLGREFEIRSWVDSFMTDDVYMVGFGMDLCEADIWWLACCKKRHFPNSKIFFYVPKWDLPQDDPRRILMDTYGIIIREISCPEKDYTAFYEMILKEFSAFRDYSNANDRLCLC